MNIHLHIDRLILDGLPATRTDAHVIQAATEAELRRLLASGELPQAMLGGRATPNIRASDLLLGPRLNPAVLGRQIARAVHGGMSQ